MKFLLTQDHIGLEVSKPYSVFIWSHYSFHLISAKRYEDIGYYGGIQVIAFLAMGQFFKKCGTLWKFNMGVNGKILKCAKSWTCLMVERKRWKFGTRHPRNCTYTCVGCFSCPTFKIQFGVIQCTLQHLRCDDCQKATAPTVFIQCQTNFVESMVIGGRGGGYRLLLFLAIPDVNNI